MNKIKWGVLDVSSWQQNIEVLEEITVLVILCSPQGIGTSQKYVSSHHCH